MSYLDFIILGVVIGSNNLAVALALGALGQLRHRLRIIVVFGVFEFVMPLLGIGLGSSTAQLIGMNMNIVGSVLLMALGLLIIVGGIHDQRRDEKLAKQITRWQGLILLALGLSMDNVVVGFSLGLQQTNALAVATTIASFSVLFSWIGITLGRESRRSWEQKAKLGAGMLLLGFGILNGMGWL